MNYRYLFVLTVLVFSMAGCTDPESPESRQKLVDTLTNEKAESPGQYYDKSVELARMNGCWACHRVERGEVGPAWRAVSERYKDDPNAREWLFYKISNGGTGNWSKITSGAVMPPYSPRVSDEHIYQLIDFILSIARDENTPRRQN